MADEFELTAEVRTDKGRGASRRLRRDADLVPAIIYGAGKDPVPLSILHKDLHKALSNEAFFSHIVTIKTDMNKEKAVLKALQRHPAKDRIMHADFYRVSMDQKINIEVPIHFLNEEECVAVKLEDGALSHLLSVLEVSCLPDNLPEFINVDVQNLHVGETIRLSEVIVPEGVEITALAQSEENDNAVVSAHVARVEVEEEVEAEGVEGAEGETPAGEGEGEADSGGDDTGGDSGGDSN